jgi:lysophospholipase L1-like esterase
MHQRIQSDWRHILSSVVVVVATAASTATAADRPPTPADLLKSAKRIVFLGDSITASGGYVVDFEAWLLAQPDGPRPTVINAGLSSETVSGLSEEGHAGGQFPRPDLAERLDRVLAKTKPDLVVACYGINCGIYQPFNAARFQKYQQGIERLKQTVEKSGAKLVIMTPPVYDDSRAKHEFSYNEVLDRYSAWLVEQRQAGWLVIDLHEPMTRALAERNKADSQFTFQPDAVHPNAAGHWFIAQQLCKAFGDTGLTAADKPAAMLKAQGLSESLLALIEKRATLRRDAYVSAAGHKRPGVAAGLPIEEAEKQADALKEQIDDAVAGEKKR